VKETALNKLLPRWEEQRNLETSEKRRLDEASTRLNTLFAKQGRVSKFRTKAERDNYLRNEIASMSNYQAGQAGALDAARQDLERARRSEVELQNQIVGLQENIEEGRRKAKELSEEISGLKEQQMEKTEKRKDLWREDTKLDSLVKRASDELRTAERALASMMDKVRSYMLLVGVWLMSALLGHRSRFACC
jgi:structural maintenance of chromosome 3 (chondroitin sulfate proteoglycan 6)